MLRYRRFQRNVKSKQRGQALVEYILILLVALVAAKTIYFNPTIGIQPNLERTLLKLGSYLEANLKSGVQPGAKGRNSAELFQGVSTWIN